MFNFFRKQPVIGIDISDYSIEILQLNRKREVLAYNRVILGEGIVHDAEILKKEKLVEKLKGALKDIKAKKAILSLPESKVFIGDFKIIPWQPEQVYTDKIGDFRPVRDKISNEVQVAVPKEIVDEHIEVARLAGIEPVAIDIESISLGRALIPEKYKSRNRASIMIIDIGARTTNLSVFNSNGALKNSITVPVAGNDFTKAIVDKLKVEWEEAEKLKRKFGFDDKKADNKVLSILQANFQKITKEIKDAIQHHENKTNNKIEEIILAGGSALLPKIDAYLAVNLEREVKIGDPFKQIKNSQPLGKKHSPILFANVVGLALRGIGNISAGINLLPQNQRSLLHQGLGGQAKIPPGRTRRVEGKYQNGPERVASRPYEAGESKTKIFFKSKLLQTISHKLQTLRKSRIFIVLFTIIAFVVLGFVVYQHIYKPSILREGSEEGQASPGTEVESGGDKALIIESSEELQEKEENDGVIEEISEVIIQNTPTGWLNVREGPRTSYSKITQVYPGESYSLLEERDDWYKIKIDEETQGWITSQYAIQE